MVRCSKSAWPIWSGQNTSQSSRLGCHNIFEIRFANTQTFSTVSSFTKGVLTDKGATAVYASNKLIQEIAKVRNNPLQMWCSMHHFKNIEVYAKTSLSDQAQSFLTNAALLIGSRWVNYIKYISSLSIFHM